MTERWTAPSIASLRGDNSIPLQRIFASLTEYLQYLSTQVTLGSLPAGGTAGQILAKIDATDYNTQWIDNFAEKTKCLVKSDNAATLAKGAVVYTSGANGTNILVKGAIATSDATSATVLGLLETSLAYNDQGYVITEGLVSGIDTSAALAGDPVWLSPTTVGGLLFGLVNKPHAPYHLVYIGVVTRAHAINGEIAVHILNGWELDELHNVAAVSPSNGDTIVYNSTTSLWEKGKYPADQLLGTALPATIVTSSLTSVGTLSSGSIPSSLLTGTIASARLSGSYTGITGVGTITTGTWSGSFGSVSGANLISLNASNLSSGTVASARISGSYTGITAVGTLTSLTTSGTILTGGNNIGSTSNYVGAIYANNWFRSSGSTGWLSETYGGGIYMIDSTWVRTYGSKSFYVGGGQIHNAKTASGSYDGSTYYAHGNGGNVGIGFYHGIGTQIILGVNDPTFYFRNSNNSGWVNVAGIINNYSSREYKQDITNFPQVVRSVGAAANPLESPALDIVGQLQPRFYRWDYEKNMDAIPRDERRRKALGRLNDYRHSKGLKPWVSDETIHRCGRDCDGADEDPCNRYKDWENGRIGFIAEEVGEVLPQAARYDMDGKYTSLDAVALVSLCVAAIKELKQQLEEVRGTAAAAG